MSRSLSFCVKWSSVRIHHVVMGLVLEHVLWEWAFLSLTSHLLWDVNHVASLHHVHMLFIIILWLLPFYHHWWCHHFTNSPTFTTFFFYMTHHFLSFFYLFTISQLSTMSPFYHLFNLTTPPFLLANIIEFIISPVSILSHAPISLFLLFHFFAISSNSSLSRFTSCIHQHSNICPAPCDFTISSSWYFTRTHHISILLGRFYHSDNKPSHSSLQMLSISRHTVLYKSFGPP